MKFCTFCGKQLQDGEVCTCEGAQTAAANAPAASKPIITKEQATEISKGLLSYAKEFVKNPVATSEVAATDSSLVTVFGLAAVNAVLALVYDILRLIINSVKYTYLDYGFMDWFKAIVGDIVWWAVLPCALAGLIVFVAKFIEKKDINFVSALSVFAIPAIPLMARTVLSLLKLLLAHEFFYVIFNFVNAGVTGILLALTGIGIVKVLGKSDKLIYSIATISAGIWAAQWLICTVIF